MKIFSNRKGDTQILNNIIGILLMSAILSVAWIASSNLAVGDSQAESIAITLGRTIETTFLTSENATVKNNCPKDTLLKIKEDKVSVELTKMFGDYEGSYNYMYEADAELPGEVNIDCSAWNFVVIDKKDHPTEPRRIIEIWGSNEE